MKRNDVIRLFILSDIFKKWHWFAYHFQFYLIGKEHRFAKSIVDAISNIESVIPGFAKSIIKKIASISGKEKFLPHYEQLIQLCAELYVLNHTISYFSKLNANISHEESLDSKDKTPELIIETDEVFLGIEVKAPSLISHMNDRYNRPSQISTRVPGLLESTIDFWGKEAITYPRDNPVKDFLLSADKKFERFKSQNQEFIGLLFIVWDDFIYEPISALLGQPSGLFLESSFAKNEQGKSITFPNVDAVVIDRHLINIIYASRDEPLLYNKRHAMDYGSKDEFPFKVVIPSPYSLVELPEIIIDCFQLYHLSPDLGAEYMPVDYIFWPHALFRQHDKENS